MSTIVLTEQTTPTTPATGKWVLYFKSSGLYYLDDLGNEIGPLDIGGGGALDDLSDVDLTGLAQGNILYYNGTSWVVLAPGTNGYFLKTQGAGANPAWASVPGGGDMLKSTYDTDNDGIVDNAEALGGITPTAAGLELLDDASAAAQRTTLGLGTMAVEAAADYVAKALFDAQTILAATADNTPAALTIAEQRLVGRITGGNIAALTAAEVRTLLGLVIGTNVQAWDADLDTWATKTAPSGAAVGTTDTQTLTNKRVNPRVSSEASSATPTINTDNVDAHSITALAVAITSMTTNLSGTPVDFQKLIIRIKDNGTARAIAWGASFEARGVALPTTTVISKVLTVGLLYDTVSAKWGCVAVAQEA